VQPLQVGGGLHQRVVFGLRLGGALRVLSVLLGAFGGGDLVQALALGGGGLVGGFLLCLAGGGGLGFLGFAHGALLGLQCGAGIGQALVLGGACFAGLAVFLVAACAVGVFARLRFGAGGGLLLLECLALGGQAVGLGLLFRGDPLALGLVAGFLLRALAGQFGALGRHAGLLCSWATAASRISVELRHRLRLGLRSLAGTVAELFDRRCERAGR
jgi:hypothetical protein